MIKSLDLLEAQDSLTELWARTEIFDDQDFRTSGGLTGVDVNASYRNSQLATCYHL